MGFGSAKTHCTMLELDRPDVSHPIHRQFYYAGMGSSALEVPYGTHDNCTCNIVRGINERHIVEQVCPSKMFLRSMKKFFRRVRRTAGSYDSISCLDVIQRMPSSKRGRYRNAHANLMVCWDSRSYRLIRTFVKADKVDFVSKPAKIPRLIQYRTAEYSLKLARYLKAFEHAIYEMRNVVVGCKGLRLIAKGLNLRERASWLRRHWDNFDNPCCLSVDVSKFDSRVHYRHLQILHGLYLRLCPSSEFRSLLSVMINNVAVGTGVRYKFKGRRCSGEMDTALGNCLLMASWVSVGAGNIHHSIFLDGDDALVFCNQQDADHLRTSLLSTFEGEGIPLKLEAHTQFGKIEFCQAKPVLLQSGWVMCPNPAKVLSTQFCSHKHYGQRNPAVMHSIAVAGLILYRGLPVLHSFFESVLRKLESHRLRTGVEVDLLARARREGVSLREARNTPISGRLSFEESWGVSPVEQLLMESMDARVPDKSWEVVDHEAWVWHPHGSYLNESFTFLFHAGAVRPSALV